MKKKTIDIHLMDMMCGWYEFVSEESLFLQDEETINQSFQFYQEAGNFSASEYPSMTDEERENYLKEFFNDKIKISVIYQS